MKIPEIIKHYRADASLREFAEKLGVSHAAVQQWENGSTEPSEDNIRAMLQHSDPQIAEMGKYLFITRHGTTLKSLIQ